MIRVLFFMVGIGLFSGPPHAMAQMRYEQGFTAYNGRTYMVPTPALPCNSASFSDHGMSVRLCVDNFGVPLPPVYPERSPASTKP